MSVVAGGSITLLGYYVPFFILSTIFQSVGAGLLTTFTVDTGSPKWIGYQIVYGACVGFGMQQPLVAVQTALHITDIPVGTAVIIFTQTFGGALFLSVGQNVFTNNLLTGLLKEAPDFDAEMILRLGAMTLKNAVSERFLPGVLEAYNSALRETFNVSLVLGCLTGLGAMCLEWKSVKGPKKDKKLEQAMAT